jgi:dihydrofolate reductase
VNYQGFESYWPTVAANPSSTKSEVEHAQWLDGSTKIVFSKTLEKVKWKNTRIVREHIAEEIAKIKHQPGKNLLLFGGASIASTFMKQGLIDEYRININPVVLGSGKPLFADLRERINLKLLESKMFKSGVVALTYVSDKK